MVHRTEHPTLTMERPPQTTDWSFQTTAGPTVALIPAHNEERFIGSLVLAARSYVDHVVVVDDGSRDRTIEIATKAGATVVQHPVNQGKAAAVNTGFAYVRRLNPSAVVMLDGDGQHCADDIPGVLAPVVEGLADIVVGSRFLQVKSDIPIYRQVGQHGLTLATNLASGVRVSDSQSGYRLGVRPDMMIIAEPLLEFDWYRENLRAVYPGLDIPARRATTWVETIAAANRQLGPICRSNPDTSAAISCAGAATAAR